MDQLSRGVSYMDAPMYIDIHALATVPCHSLRRTDGVVELGPSVLRDAQLLLGQELAQACAGRGCFHRQPNPRSGAHLHHKGTYLPNPMTSSSVWQHGDLDHDVKEKHQVFVNRDCPATPNHATIAAHYDPTSRSFTAPLASNPMWKQENTGQEPTQAAVQGNFGQTEAASSKDPDALAMMKHQRGDCRPCVFFFNGACSEGPSCKYCHVPHPKSDYQRIRLSKPKLAKLKEFHDRPFISFTRA